MGEADAQQNSRISARVSSLVVRVSDLDQSIKFYGDVFSCRVSLRESDTALLLTPDGFQLYLHSIGPPRHHDVCAVGLQHLMWATDSETELQELTQRLRSYDSATFTYSEGGVTFVEGCNPDGGRVIIACPSVSKLPRQVIAARFQ